MNYLKRFFKEDDGAEIMEYAVIIIIVIVLVVVVLKIKDAISGKLEDAAEGIDNIDVGSDSE